MCARGCSKTLRSARSDATARFTGRHSPDLTPMDFFVWGWVKDQVYRQPVDSLDELKVRIAQTMNGMPLDFAAHSLLSFKSRLQSCINNEGRHVEH